MRRSRIQPRAYLAYVKEQLDVMRRELPDAVGEGSVGAVHRVRVASRRLKAALDLIRPIADGASLKRLRKLSKTLRRRVGAVRDADVMAKTVAGYRADEATVKPLLRALRERRALGLADAERAVDVAAIADDLTLTRSAMAALRECLPALESLLREAVHAQLDAFAAAASSHLSDCEAGDLHALRIDGKRLRYTLEMAAAVHFPVRPGDLAAFKAMQDHLADWHDAAVLCSFIADDVVASQRPLKQTAEAAAALALAARVAKKGQASADAFRAMWRSRGAAIEASIRDSVPASLPVEVSDSAKPQNRIKRSRTGRGRSRSG